MASMRDEDDRPILQAAIETVADAILTGDKGFHALDLDMERPKIISPSDFLQGTVFMRNSCPEYPTGYFTLLFGFFALQLPKQPQAAARDKALSATG